MAMMSPLEWQRWAQGARANQSNALSRLLPILQAQAAQQAYQQGGTGGLLGGGFFPQAAQAGQATLSEATAPYRAAQAADIQSQIDMRQEIFNRVSGEAGDLQSSATSSGARAIGDMLAASGQTEQASYWRQRGNELKESERRAAGEIIPAQFTKLGERNFRVGSPYITQRRYFQTAKNALKDAEEAGTPGGADFALMQAYAKLLDPMSVLREGEAGIIVEQGSSEVKDWVRRMRRLFTEQGVLNPSARLNLIRQTNAIYQGTTNAQEQMYGEMRQEAQRLPGSNEGAVSVAVSDLLAPAPAEIDTTFWQSESDAADSPEEQLRRARSRLAELEAKAQEQ